MILIVNAKCQSYEYSFSNDSFENVGWRTCIFCGGAGNGGGDPSEGGRGLVVCDVTRRVLAMGLSRLELRHGFFWFCTLATSVIQALAGHDPCRREHPASFPLLD